MQLRVFYEAILTFYSCVPMEQRLVAKRRMAVFVYAVYSRDLPKSMEAGKDSNACTIGTCVGRSVQ